MTLNFAFIFDMDGVIVDSNPYHKIALQQFVSKYGYHLTEQELKEKIYGRTNMDWIANLFGPMPKIKLLELEEEKESLFRKLIEPDIKPVKGIIPFLKSLDSLHIPRAIATSAPPSNVGFTLKNTGTEEFFTTILDESHISRGKPDPEIYSKTIVALGMDPARCIVFEDSLSGIQAALAAGCKVVAITTTHPEEELGEAHAVISDFSGLDPVALARKLLPG